MSFLDDYEPVEDRLVKFWADHPEGQINTRIIPAPEGQWIVEASVWRSRSYVLDVPAADSGPYAQMTTKLDVPYAGARPDSTGLAQETVTAKGVNSTSALENCETSAIGRALANLGYAAKGKRASREEMSKAKRGEEPVRPDYAVWLADNVEIFKGWDEDERKLAYAAAMKRIDLPAMTSMDDAHRIFAEMQVIYSERPLQSDALPLEDK